MESKTFSRIFMLIILIISGIMLFWIAQQRAHVITNPAAGVADTSVAASTTQALSQALTVAVETQTPQAETVQPQVPQEYLSTTTIKAPKGVIQAMTATTSDEREQGLSDRISLATSSGMLFQFDTPGSYGFWMKDMYFSLDFVWISANKKVIAVNRNITPETYPQVFYPPMNILYVLELNSGVAAKEGIATGTQLVF